MEVDAKFSAKDTMVYDVIHKLLAPNDPTTRCTDSSFSEQASLMQPNSYSLIIINFDNYCNRTSMNGEWCPLSKEAAFRLTQPQRCGCSRVCSQTLHIKLDCSFFLSTSFYVDNTRIVHFKWQFFSLMLCATMPSVHRRCALVFTTTMLLFPSWCILGHSSWVSNFGVWFRKVCSKLGHRINQCSSNFTCWLQM